MEKSNMKALFWVGKATFFGKLIRWFKRHRETHSEILFSDGFSGTANPGLGVEIYKLNFNKNDWVVLNAPQGTTMEQEKIVRDFIQGEVGQKYDWRGVIFCQIFPWGWESNDDWFCTEIDLTALQKAFPELKGPKPHQQDAYELMTLLLLKGWTIGAEPLKEESL